MHRHSADCRLPLSDTSAAGVKGCCAGVRSGLGFSRGSAGGQRWQRHRLLHLPGRTAGRGGHPGAGPQRQLARPWEPAARAACGAPAHCGRQGSAAGSSRRVTDTALCASRSTLSQAAQASCQSSSCEASAERLPTCHAPARWSDADRPPCVQGTSRQMWATCSPGLTGRGRSMLRLGRSSPLVRKLLGKPRWTLKRAGRQGCTLQAVRQLGTSSLPPAVPG